MEQEKWIQQINWINQLKLRVGYGVTGNSAVNPYQKAGSVTSTYASIPFGAVSYTNLSPSGITSASC